MSLLSPGVHAEMSELLQLLQSPDNHVRSQAEAHLQDSWYATRREILLMGLAEQIQGSPDFATRSFAAVIFRRMSSKQIKIAESLIYTFRSFSQEVSIAIRQKLLEALLSETDRTARNKISDAVAELARQYAENDETWAELLGGLVQLSMATDPEKRGAAWRVFTTTPGIIEKQHETAVLEAFRKGFKDESVPVRISAMDAFAAFFRIISKKAQPKYTALIPEILNILPPMKASHDSEELSKALLALVELASISSKMFRTHFSDLVAFCVSVIQDKELDNTCRQNSLELLATFADYAPSICRKDPEYTNHMITQCLSLMTDLGDDDDDAAEWMASDDLNQDESDLNHVAGEQTMDRLANKLGGGTILAPTFHWLPRMMSSLAWRDRHAALMAISAISEGCRDLMIGELGQVLDLVVPALTDAHPRVRWAGCNALGQMSTDFSPKMQNDFYDRVLTAIIPVLNSPEARVQSHAAAALVNFCEEAEKASLEPYLDDLLAHLFQLLRNEERYVQEQALSTIATIADAAEAAFSKYYDTLMPLLISVLQQEIDKDKRLLRSKAMECATLIALAVGRERLGSDALTLVQLLASIQAGITDADDPQAQYLMHCWGRMCRVLERDFVSFLPTVMPPLLDVASTKCDMALLDDDEQIEQLRQEDGWDLVPVRGKMIGIKTSVMDDKHMATELLVVYAQVLGADFATYVPQIMETIALPGLVFLFHDPVRVVSAKLVPQLVNCCVKAYGVPSMAVATLWNTTVEKLIDVLKAEPAIETLAEMYQSFYESVEALGNACLTQGHMSGFIDAAAVVLTDYRGRVTKREQERDANTAEDAEDEAEELQIAIEEDQTLLSDMNKAFHAILKNHGTSFLPEWERLAATYGAFLLSTDPMQRQWGLCIIDDVLEFCGSESVRYAELMSQPLADGCRDASAPIRQAAAYGIGEAARCGGSGWGPFVANTIPLLFAMGQWEGARDDENVFATENACVAIAKILRFAPAHVADVDEVTRRWVEMLPVNNDEEGAPYAYAYLVELINHQHPVVLGQASKIFIDVGEALEAESIRGDLAQKVVQATKALLTSTKVDATPLLQHFSPATQQMIAGHFA